MNALDINGLMSSWLCSQES